MSLRDLDHITFQELMSIYDQRQKMAQESWMQARLIAWSNLAPNAKKGKLKSPKDLFKLPGDEQIKQRPKVFSRITPIDGN